MSYVYNFEFEPVQKLRERVTMRGSFPALYTDPKVKAFEGDVERIGRFQHRALSATAIQGRLIAEIDLYVSNKRGDVDNYAKSILDGMQKAQIFANDNQIDKLTVNRFFVDKGKERFTVAIRLL